MTNYLQDHAAYARLYLPRAKENDPTLTKIELIDRYFKDVDAANLAGALERNTHITDINIISNFMTDEGLVRLASAFEQNRTVTRLDFENNSIGSRGVQALLQTMRHHNHTITEVNLARNRVAEDVLQDLETACLLNKQPTPLKKAIIALQDGTEKSLDLTAPTEDKPYTPVATQLLSEALKSNSVLTSLDISNNNIGDACTTLLSDALLTNTTLTELKLRHNEISSEGAVSMAEILRVNNKLTELDLGDNQISDMGAQAFVECLKVNNTVTLINLELNNIGPTVMSQLLHGLMMNSQPADLKSVLPQLQLNSSLVSKLELSYYTEATDLRINDVSARVLLNALRENTTVKYIDLSNNRITSDGAKLLAQLLQTNQVIHTLLLNNNKITDSGAESLVKALQSNHVIKQLEVDDNPVSDHLKRQLRIGVQLNSEPLLFKQTAPMLMCDDAGVEILDFSLRAPDDNPCTPNTCHLLVEVLQHNSKLRELCLADNQPIGGEGLKTVCEMLGRNQCSGLKILDLRNNFIGNQGAQLITDTLKDNISLTKLDLSNNNITSVSNLVEILGDNNHTLTKVLLNGNDVPQAQIRDLELLTQLNHQPIHFKTACIELFANNPKLTDLNLCEYEKRGAGQYRYKKQYNDKSAFLVCEALKYNTCLTSINLSNNLITDVGAKYIAEMITQNCTLTTINLSNNQITDEGFLKIARSLLENVSITMIGCEDNNIHSETRKKLNMAAQSNAVKEEATYDKIAARARDAAELEHEIDKQILTDALKNVPTAGRDGRAAVKMILDDVLDTSNYR